MIFRAIALSMALLIGMGTIVPLMTESTEAGPRKHKKTKKKQRKHKKYSKKWWRSYHQRNQRSKSLAARKRSLRLRQIRLANAAKNQAEKNTSTQSLTAKTNRRQVVEDTTPAVLPSGEKAPKGWKRNAVSNSELQFRVEDDKGSNIGSASISVVGPAIGADSDNARSKTVGGVQTGALRRTVIDRMIKEEGWVVNDYQKEVGGKKVYVVVAQSPGAGGAVQSRLFYFTEVDGRIYSVTANAPKDNIARIEQESEKVINALQRKSGTVQQANLK